MKIALTADHAGFEAYQEIGKFLEEQKHEVFKYGPENYQPNDDYPDFVYPAAKAIADKKCEVGIIIGGSGEGEAISANRLKGVRCTVFYGPVSPINPIEIEGTVSSNPYEIIQLARQHNLSNMLSLASRFLSIGEMKRAIILYLDTPFGDDIRHLRRIKKIDEESLIAKTDE